MSINSAVQALLKMWWWVGVLLLGMVLLVPQLSEAAQTSKWSQKSQAAQAADSADSGNTAARPSQSATAKRKAAARSRQTGADAAVAAAAADADAGDSMQTTSSKRRVARSRKDMILEVEMRAVKEALAVKQDEESTNKFVTKADQEFQNSQAQSIKSKEYLGKATEEAAKLEANKQAVMAIIEKVKAATDEVQALAREAQQAAKLAGVETVTAKQNFEEAKQEVIQAEARETMAMDVLDRAQQKEIYYRELVKRRMRNAEDFYYIAEAALQKGGNAQSMEFSIKAKAEIEQAKIAENEAAIRAEAVIAADKVVQSRRQGTEAARIRQKASAQITKLAEEIAISLKDASESARASAQAAQIVMAKAQNYVASEDEVATFVGKKVESLTAVKDADEKKEAMAGDAVQSAKAVLAAKQKAQAQAEARAQSALAEARTLVIQPSETQQAPASPAETAK